MKSLNSNHQQLLFLVQLDFPQVDIYYHPSKREIAKVETAGINTIVIPDITPGKLKGKITFLKV